MEKIVVSKILLPKPNHIGSSSKILKHGSSPDLENRFTQDFRKDFGVRMNKNGNIHRE